MRMFLVAIIAVLVAIGSGTACNQGGGGQPGGASGAPGY